MKYLEVSFKNDWYKEKYNCSEVRTLKVRKSTERAVLATMVEPSGKTFEEMWIPISQITVIGEKTENTKSDLKMINVYIEQQEIATAPYRVCYYTEQKENNTFFIEFPKTLSNDAELEQYKSKVAKGRELYKKYHSDDKNYTICQFSSALGDRVKAVIWKYEMKNEKTARKIFGDFGVYISSEDFYSTIEKIGATIL